MESFEKGLKGPKNCKFEKSVKRKKVMKKMKTMFKKSQQNFQKLLLKCTEVHKTEIKKSLNFTEDTNTFYTKTLKKSVKRLKTVSGKTNWALQDWQKILTKQQKKHYFDEKKFRRVKRVQFEEIVEACRKIHKAKIKIKKKQKSYLKIDKNTCEKETKAAGVEHWVKNTKNFQKKKEMPPKWTQPANFEKALKRLKNSFFSKKVFRYLKEITNFLNEALKSDAKLKKHQKFKQIKNLQIANKVWKQALENEKNCQKQEKNVEKWKNF